MCRERKTPQRVYSVPVDKTYSPCQRDIQAMTQRDKENDEMFLLHCQNVAQLVSLPLPLFLLLVLLLLLLAAVTSRCN